jgi:hypothetical protein
MPFCLGTIRARRVKSRISREACERFRRPLDPVPTRRRLVAFSHEVPSVFRFRTRYTAF